MSSVQTSLRVLVSNELVLRQGDEPPRYQLSREHPATTSLVGTATVIGDAAQAIGIVVRANPAVAWAGVDAAGFILGMATDPPPDSLAELDQRLDMIALSRPSSLTVERLPLPELERLVRVALELRARIRAAVTIKGRPPLAAREAADDRSRRAG